MKMKVIILMIASALINFCSYSQITFEKTYGGTGSDVGYDVENTIDGGFIISGFTYSYGAGANDCYMVKTNNNGIFQWQKTYGGVSAEFGISVLQNSKGQYIIAGTTISYGNGTNDYYVIKTKSNGDTIWTKTYGDWLLESPRKMVATKDSGYAIIGRTESYGIGSSSVYFVKIDSVGNQQFYQAYGGSGLNWGMSIQQTTDGGYIIAGKTTSFNAQGQDFYLIKTNVNGDTTWTKYWGGTGDDWLNDIQQTADGGYLISGTYNYVGTTGDTYIAKTDGNGTVQWSKTYGSLGDDFINHEIISTTGGYVFVGATTSHGAGNYDLYLLKTDVNGDTLWTKTYGGTGVDAGHSLKQTPDGGYVIVGQTSSKGSGSNDVYLIKTNSSGKVTGINEFALGSQTSTMVYPNPFKEKTKIIIDKNVSVGPYTVTLYDVLGNAQDVKYNQTNEIIIEKGNTQNGIYFYKITDEKNIIGSGRLVIE